MTTESALTGAAPEAPTAVAATLLTLYSVAAQARLRDAMGKLGLAPKPVDLEAEAPVQAPAPAEPAPAPAAPTAPAPAPAPTAPKPPESPPMGDAMETK